MKKRMIRKAIVLGIIMLFVGASVTPSIAGYDKDVEKTDYIIDENEKHYEKDHSIMHKFRIGK